MERPEKLRFVTYLSPGIPLAFFEAVVDHVRRALGWRASLSVETRVSGPVRGGDDPFSEGEADVGFMCTPSFFWLRELEGPPVELLPAAPVFGDCRAPGRPVYFSEVVVRRESPARSFLDLRGRSWAYNDPCSLSGYYNLLKKLAEMGEDGSFFDRVCCSKSHLNSIQMVAGSEVDAAAIDSNVLRINLGSAPGLGERLRVIETWGPFPIQPVVLRSGLHPELKERLRVALLAIATGPHASPTLDEFGLERFAPVTYEHYASEEQALRKCESKLGTRLR
ncbi:MAG: ABC transporter, substrate-binding protein (cluster 12, methionine/phosphonates) [uncultured Rubrobacteraceae bacterium]|uniref:ABC transporter, substrate-binding protein (Cluster 12, methionine/phosphonates) n=1 Tax=uncultured Rubrobacteraceae bacterium TaxID=349277 RepID=A0A6J4QPU9_9ACTN|nr:MAG: ABC transporter, substrate-binding protein (cluster 12, methionine/phosphonates) [uncultured Rubrobacteraceae bacterium]